mmetsp:Transcript_4602/g.6751  ORF Transcript_4602/g.6751 Transcript_4602/m.6751 type:complete len:457 (+) Transcript_4602:56-1426(+)
MPQEDIGVEVIDLETKDKEEMVNVSPSSIMLLKTSSTWPLSEDVSASAVASSESRSFELEYSDEEDFSVASNVYEDDSISYGLDDNDGNGNRNGSADGGVNEEGQIVGQQKREDSEQQRKLKQPQMHVMYDYPSTRTLDLVIDEMPMIQRKATVLTNSNVNNKSDNDKNSNLVRSKSFTLPSSSSSRPVKKPEKITACPCCGSYVHYHVTKKEHKLTSPETEMTAPATPANVLSSFVDSLWCTHSGDENDVIATTGDENDPSIVKTLDYTIKACIVEGWLYKKGTGNDIFRSTFWKPRWCRLVLANIPGKCQHVPLLLVSWHVSVNPSNIIILESSVAISVDYDDVSGSDATTADNVHCFDIVSRRDSIDDTTVCRPVGTAPAPKKLLSNGKLTRTFSVPSVEERDDWVLKINQAIGNYDKSRRMAIRQKEERLLPPTSPVRRTPKGGLNGLSIAC